MEPDRVWALRDALRHTDWWERADTLGQAIRRTPGAGHLLLVGTPQVEPWHLAAHLDDEARLSGLDQLAPQLVRWNPPPHAPSHLAIGLSRLEAVSRGETVFVVSPDVAPDPLLERVDDARRIGATIVALDGGDGPLADLAHERMTVSASGLAVPEGLASSVESSSVESSAGEGGAAETGALEGGAVETGALEAGSAPSALLRPGDLPSDVLAGLSLPASFELAQHFVSAAAGSPGPARRQGWRSRLAQLLDTISGPQPSQRSSQR